MQTGKTVEVVFDPSTGEATIEAINYEGSTCGVDLAAIERAVGVTKKRTPKAHNNLVRNTVRAGGK